MNVQIVTDSCAHVITPHFWEQHTVTVVPNRITIAGKQSRLRASYIVKRST